MPRNRKSKHYAYKKMARAILKDYLYAAPHLTLEEQNRIADKKFYDYMRANGRQDEADYFEPITAKLWYGASSSGP